MKDKKERQAWVVAILIRWFAFPVFIMLIWNGVIASVFELPRLTYWNSFWIRLLVDLLWDDGMILTRLGQIKERLDK